MDGRGGCRPLPDEEGTESRDHRTELCRPAGCRPLPDEEGTERHLRCGAAGKRARVADRSPMRRGLKDDHDGRRRDCQRRVADRSPMRRGLKVRSRRSSSSAGAGCRPLPDEEGTERHPWAARWATSLRSCRPLPDEEGTESSVTRAPASAAPICCRPLPDEEGTERFFARTQVRMPIQLQTAPR